LIDTGGCPQTTPPQSGEVITRYRRICLNPNSLLLRIDTGGSLPPKVVGIEPFAAVEIFALATRFRFGFGVQELVPRRRFRWARQHCAAPEVVA